MLLFNLKLLQRYNKFDIIKLPSKVACHYKTD